LYRVESPESWFEDFGEAALVCGEASIALDPDFAAVVDTSKYHVFLSGYDGRSDLSVCDRSPDGFRAWERRSGGHVLLACGGEAEGHCRCSARACRDPEGTDAARRAGLSLRTAAVATGLFADGSATAPAESEAVVS
jgi:hypothetical protein